MDLCKNRKEQRHDNDYGVVEDRLSNLPDAILAYILSFFSIKKAVSTSALSKRWISLWTFVPKLSISVGDVDLLERKSSDVVRFVDRVLIGHEMPFLEEIEIDCDSFDQSSLDSWISAVVQHNVRKLNITSLDYDEYPCILPSCLFTMSKIVSLQLEYCVVLRFPSVLPCFTNLKELVLRYLAYEDDESIQNLISSCTVLEVLVLHRKHVDGLETLNVSSRSLKSLSLFHKLFWPQLDYIPTISIDCPTVEYIHIDDDVTEKFIVKDLSSVVHAKLDLSNLHYPFHELGPSASHIFELLAVFSNVKALSISESTISAISGADGEILPTFHNLKYLKFFNILDDAQWNMTGIIEFLKSTPVLVVLSFEGSSFSGEEFNSYSENVPNCLTSHLKTIEVVGYFGKCDMDAMAYFVKNSKVLENVSVKRRGEEELVCLPCSSKCRISFS